MSDPTRWLDDNNVDDFTKQLLTAGRNEQLPRKRAAAIAAGLGASAASSVASAGTAWGIGKVVLLLATVGSIGVGGYLWSQRSPEAASKPPTQTDVAPAPAPAAVQTPAPVTAPTPAVAPVAVPAPPLPAAPAVSVHKAPTVPPPAPASAAPAATAPAPANDLAAEVALLDRVNRALNSHDIVAAAASMSEYRTIFPHGALAAAAAAVDFEIARQQGDRATAIARGTEFLQQYPTSPLRKRIEARLQELQPQESP